MLFLLSRGAYGRRSVHFKYHTNKPQTQNCHNSSLKGVRNIELIFKINLLDAPISRNLLFKCYSLDFLVCASTLSKASWARLNLLYLIITVSIEEFSFSASMKMKEWKLILHFKELSRYYCFLLCISNAFILRQTYKLCLRWKKSYLFLRNGQV